MTQTDIGEWALPMLVSEATLAPWLSGGTNSWLIRTCQPPLETDAMADREILSLSERDLVQLVQRGFEHIGNACWLSESPLAACSLTAAAVVPDGEPLDELDLGRALQVVLTWVLNRLAPGPVAHPLGGPRPADDPSWRQPAWWMYNVLRHRYLDPAERLESDKEMSLSERLLNLTGIPARHQLNRIRSRALRQAAGCLRQALIEQSARREVQRAAIEEFCRPLAHRAGARKLLKIASVFRCPFPRHVLVEMAAAEGIPDAQELIAMLLARRMLAAGEESGALRVPARLQQHLAPRAANPRAVRWHAVAAEQYPPQKAPRHAAWHLFHAERYSEFLLAALPSITRADTTLCQEWKGLFERVPVAQLSSEEKVWLCMGRAYLSALLNDQKLLARACTDLINSGGTADARAKALIFLAKGIRNDSVRTLELLSQAAQVAPEGSITWVGALLHQAFHLTDLRRTSEALDCLGRIQRSFTGTDVVTDAMIKLCLAICHLQNNQIDLALPLAQRALALFVADNNLNYIPYANVVLSSCFRLQGDAQTALAYAQEAVDLCRERGAPGLSGAVQSMARALLAGGHAQQALVLLKEELEGAKDSRSPHQLFGLHVNSMEACAAVGDLSAAARHAASAHELASREGMNGLLKDLERRVAENPTLCGALGGPQPSVLERLAFDMIERDGAVAAGALARIADVSATTARHALGQLCAAGQLVRTGAGRSVRYLVPSSPAADHGQQQAPPSGLDADTLKLIARTGSITIRELQEQLNIPRSTAQHVISRLTARGRVTVQGKGRATIYLPAAE